MDHGCEKMEIHWIMNSNQRVKVSSKMEIGIQSAEHQQFNKDLNNEFATHFIKILDF